MTSIKLTFLGDILCHKEMLDSYKGKDGFKFNTIFAPCSNLFHKSNFIFANLETPISLDNSNLTNTEYSFCAPFEFAQDVYDSGINFVSTANNHCLDRGVNGISSTIQSLNRIGLLHTGIFDTPQKKDAIINIDGVKIGVLSYTYGTNAFANNEYLSHSNYWRVNLFQNQELSFFLDRWLHRAPQAISSRIYRLFLTLKRSTNLNKPVFERKEFNHFCRKNLKRDINKIKKINPDILIMLMHTGGQYNKQASKETESLTKYLFDNGINIICGNHEHIVHGTNISLNENKVASYSLGNFISLYGTLKEPFDLLANYSIAWHVYISKDSKRIQKTSFSILKTIIDSDDKNKIKTIPLANLYSMTSYEDEKDRLLNDAKHIAKKFCNLSILEILPEYEIK